MIASHHGAIVHPVTSGVVEHVGSASSAHRTQAARTAATRVCERSRTLGCADVPGGTPESPNVFCRAMSPISRPELDRRGLLVLALAFFALELIVIRQYGWFRDEFYYLVCADHPAA